MAKPINCEDNSDEEGWSYCGKRECVSCGVGDEKKASFDRAFRTGWAIAKNDNILSPEEALKVCHAGGCVWIKDYADENYGDEDYPHFDYPVEDPEDLMTILEDAEHGGMPITILADPEPLEAPFHSTRERIDLGGSRDE